MENAARARLSGHMDDLDKLKQLSLIKKVCTELRNHGVTDDRDLAEFLIHLAKEHETLAQFCSAVADIEGGFPSALLTSIHRAVQHHSPKSPPKRARPSPREDEQHSAPTSFLGSGIDAAAVRESTDREYAAAISRRPAQSMPIENPRSTDVVPGAVVRGRVTNVRHFGAFVLVCPDREGLIHVSRQPHGADAQLSRGANVWVKVLSVAGGRIALSMREVDQLTGAVIAEDGVVRERKPRDLEAERFREERRRIRGSKDSGHSVSGIPAAFVRDGLDTHSRSGRMRRALPETEQWELTQLAKILPQRELRKHLGANSDFLPSKNGENSTRPLLRDRNDMNGERESEGDGTTVLLGEAEEPTEEVEIELNEDEPAFWIWYQ